MMTTEISRAVLLELWWNIMKQWDGILVLNITTCQSPIQNNVTLPMEHLSCDTHSRCHDEIYCNTMYIKTILNYECTRVHPKVYGLAAWDENCKWYSSLPLGAVVSLFCDRV